MHRKHRSCYELLVPLTLALLFALLLTLTTRAYAQSPWGHTVIMFPPAGATFTVPLVPEARNCVYITDCTENILSKPPVEPPQAISETPSPRDAYGWSFNVPIDRTNWAVEVDDEEPNGTAPQFKGIAAIDNEIGMFFRDTGITNTFTLQTTAFNQPGSIITLRVSES